jgi:predicted Zn-dependent protease
MRPAARQKILVGVLLLLALGAGGIWGRGAWQQAERRELFLPDLEARAKDSPRDENIQLALAYRLIQARLFAPAAAALQKGAEAGNADLTLWQTWAAANAASGDTGLALAVLKTGANDPKIATALKAAAGRLQALPQDASPFDAALAISPEGPEALTRYLPRSPLSGLIESQGRRNPAQAGFATLETLSKERPKDDEIQKLWARALAKNRRFPDAETALIARLKEKPEDYELILTLADVRYQAGLPARAGSLYRACVKERPDDFRAVLGLAKSATDKSLIYLGASSAEKAVKLNPKSADAWVCLGRSHFNQKLRWDKVIEAFEKARALEPGRLEFYGELYDALRLSGRFEEAQKILRERLATAPDDARAHYLLGTALLDNPSGPGSDVEAEKSLKRSLELYPDSATGSTRLGQFLLDRDRPAEAMPWLQRATELDPYSDRAFTLLARAFRQQKQTAQAEQAERIARNLNRYKQALQPLEEQRLREPTNVSVRKKLAVLYREGGEDQKAKQEDETVYMLEKFPERAEKGLKGLMNERQLAASTEWDLNQKKPSPSPAPEKPK